MKKILFIYRTKRGYVFDAVKRKKEPDHLLYGANHFKGLGFKILYSDLAYNFNFLHYVFFPLERLYIKIISVGFKIDQGLLLLPIISKADVVVTTADSAGLPILLLKRLKIIKKPIVYISTGFINELAKKNKLLLMQHYKWLFQAADEIICHSIDEQDLYHKILDVQKDRVNFLPFGIDSNYFFGKRKNGDYVYSVGRDRSRDIRLLSKVAQSLPGLKFVLTTSRNNINGIKIPKNVFVEFDQPYSKVLQRYLECRLLFVPLKEINRASGQMSFLEGIASGNKVVVGRVRGLSDIYPDCFKYKNVYSYKPGDVKDAVRVIKKAMYIKFKPNEVKLKYNSVYYAKHLARIVRNV